MNELNIENIQNTAESFSRPKEIFRAAIFVCVGITLLGLTQVLEANFFLNNYPKIQHQFMSAGFIVLGIGALGFVRIIKGKSRLFKANPKIRYFVMAGLGLSSISNLIHFFMLYAQVHSVWADAQAQIQMINALFRAMVFIPITVYVCYLLMKKNVRNWYQSSNEKS